MATTTVFNSFLSSLSLILASELGDKTFFITSIMAIKYSLMPVFLGSMTAMTIMNIFSICLGILTKNMNPWLIHYISITLFVVCGLNMLIEGIRMSEEDSLKEYHEAKKLLLDKKQTNHNNNNNNNNHNINNNSTTTMQEANGNSSKSLKHQWFGQSPQRAIFLQVFSLIFFAEWGDKSQLSTILLAAKEGYCAVGLGAFVGYLICNGIAVLGSQAITKIISVKFVTIIGGLIFVLCSIFKFFSV